MKTPPSQKKSSPICVMGNVTGKLPLAMMWSKVSSILLLSKRDSRPVLTFTAVTIRRVFSG